MEILHPGDLKMSGEFFGVEEISKTDPDTPSVVVAIIS